MNPYSRGYQMLQKSLISVGHDNQPQELHELQPVTFPVNLPASSLSTPLPDFLNISFTDDPADLSLNLNLDVHELSSANLATPSGAAAFFEKTCELPTAGHETPEPATTGYPPEPATTGLLPEPATTGLASEPAATGFAEEPATTGLALEPATAGLSPKPATTGLSPEPATTGFVQEPATTELMPEPATTGLSPKSATTGPVNIEDSTVEPPQWQNNAEATSNPEEMSVLEPEILQMQAHQHQGKRKRQPEKWKATIKKAKRESGLEYVGRKYNDEGTFVEVTKPSKKIGERCGCKKANCQKVTDEERKEVFEYIWSLSNPEKAAFIKGLVDCVKPVEKKEGESRRSWSMRYHLRVNGARVKVCKTFFLRTTGLCNWWVHNILTCGLGVAEGEVPRERKRMREETTESMALKQFLCDLPKLPSHYCRKESSKLYLEPIFQSIQAVYLLYKEKCESEGTKVLSTFKFKEEFNAMNLSLFHPRKDRCDICVGFEEGNVEEETYNTHRLSAKRAQDEKTADKEKCMSNPKIKCITMDLQSVLLCPRTNASALYYKTKLCVHNFTVYDLQSKNCVCYVWNECEGGLTANEFASCLSDFLSSDLTPDEYIIYSDGCGYQNRNVTMSSALLHFSTVYDKTVTQKFLEKGHTQMEVDSAHSTIERNFKNKSIYCPADYVRLMQESRRVNPYVVKYLTHDFFSDFTKVTNLTSIRPGRGAGDPVVFDLRAIRYTPDGELKYKLGFDHNWSHLPLKRGESTSILCKDLKKLPLYQGRRKISQAKFKHMQEMKSVVPSDYHNFYDSLPH